MILVFCFGLSLVLTSSPILLFLDLTKLQWDSPNKEKNETSGAVSFKIKIVVGILLQDINGI